LPEYSGTGERDLTDPPRPDTASPAAVLEYRNELLCSQLQRNLSLPRDEAHLLFEDLKRYLSLSFYTDLPLPPPREIDKGWHEFILMTRDYFDFCETYFGRYLHHQPSSNNASREDAAAGRNHTRELARRIFGVLSDNWM
jgi:hypothetical protein